MFFLRVAYFGYKACFKIKSGEVKLRLICLSLFIAELVVKGITESACRSLWHKDYRTWCSDLRCGFPTRAYACVPVRG